jgi:hypothetical protein
MKREREVQGETREKGACDKEWVEDEQNHKARSSHNPKTHAREWQLKQHADSPAVVGQPGLRRRGTKDE